MLSVIGGRHKGPEFDSVGRDKLDYTAFRFECHAAALQSFKASTLTLTESEYEGGAGLLLPWRHDLVAVLILVES